MDKLFLKTKIWLSKAIQCVRDTVVNATSVISCFRHCHSQFLHRHQRRRHNRPNSINDENNIKITFGDHVGPQLPGVIQLDDFHRNRPRIGDSSNSTTTEESASDDSLLGSPNVDQRNSDRRLVQVDLALKSGLKEHAKWTSDDGSCVFHPMDECTHSDMSDQSTNATSLTSHMCSSCSTSPQSPATGCDQLRKINAELTVQVRDGHERILNLERQLLELKNPQSMTMTSGYEDISDQPSSLTLASELMEITSSNSFELQPRTSNLPPAPPLPPPAPPLPPGNWIPSTSNTNTKNRKSVPIPSCALKTLNWIKLNEDSLAGTVWSGLDDEKLYNLLDLKELDKHFACGSNYDAFGTIRSRLSVCSMIREISVLDARRAQNCAILLSKLKLSDREIKDAVLTLDSDDRIPKDMAEQLLKFIPTKEEIQLLGPYLHSKDVLHPADRFFIEISTIKRYEQRLQCLCFKKSFTETIEETTKKISNITSASRRVLASKRLRKILGTILAVGNYLNYSKRSSDAYGFHLSVLTNLQDMKSGLNNEYTLMHYLTEFCHKSMPDVFGLLQETAVCMEAAKISGTDMQLDIEKLKDGLKLLANEIKTIETMNKNEDDILLSVGKPLLNEYKEAYSTLENSFKEMKNAFTACCKAYAPEDHFHETLNVSEFFGYFAQFLNQFTIVESQIMRKRHEQEMRTLTLTRTKAKRQTTITGMTHTIGSNGFNQRTRRSGRITKKAVTDVNEDLLTSVLMAMDQRRVRATANVSEVILCGPRQRRSFRLSTKRKQLKSSSDSSNGTVIRRRTSTHVNAPIGECEDNVHTENEIVDNGLDNQENVKINSVNGKKRHRSRHTESLCRER